MNKYLYPIYKTKLKPWIKYWLIKRASVKPVTGTYTLASGQSPLTILKALKAPIKSLTLYGDCNQVQREGTNLINSVEYNHGITSNGNITGTNIQYLGIEDYTPIEPDTTYTITFQHYISGATLYVGYKDSGGVFISRTSLGKDTKTFTTPNNAYYGFFYYYINSGFDTIGGYVMLNAGSEALPYEPYGYKPSPTNPSPVQTITGQTSFTISDGTSSTFSIIPLGSIELCKIGNYEDSIFEAITGNAKYDSLDSTTKASLTYGNWYIEKNVGKVVLNGSETGWHINNTGTVNWYYEINNSKLIPIAKVQNNQLSNYYPNGEIYNGNTNTGIMVLNRGHTIRIRYGSEDTIANYQTWLSSNNVNVYYVLAEATITEITDDLLLTILNGLENVETFKGTNVVAFSDLNPNISFEYLKEDEV